MLAPHLKVTRSSKYLRDNSAVRSLVPVSCNDPFRSTHSTSRMMISSARWPLHQIFLLALRLGTLQASDQLGEFRLWIQRSPIIEFGELGKCHAIKRFKHFSAFLQGPPGGTASWSGYCGHLLRSSIIEITLENDGSPAAQLRRVGCPGRLRLFPVPLSSLSAPGLPAPGSG